MKKVFLLICFSLSSLTGSQAQETFFWGVKGGVNFSRLNFDGYNSNNRTGFHAGVSGEFRLDEEFAVQSEILYSAQGGRVEMTSFDGPVIYDINLNYLQVPLALKYYLLNDLAIEAGPSFNFLINEQLKATYLDMLMTHTPPKEVGKLFEFGGLLGLSYKLPGNFLLSSRYTYGLTDAFKKSAFSENSIHNHGFQIGTGYIF